MQSFSPKNKSELKANQEELKFVCLSDTHNCHPKVLEQGDVLIHCGDFTYRGEAYEIKNFNEWLDSQHQFKYKIIIAGNHDLPFDIKKSRLKFCKDTEKEINILKNKENCYYLENQGIEIEGYKIWGSPYSLEYYQGSFQIKPHQSEEMWEKIDNDADIVLTHGPPYGYGDIAQSEVNEHVGDQALLKRIKQIKPKYHIFGHIHEGYGKFFSEEDGINFINCSYLKKNYSGENKPITFTLPIKQKIYNSRNEMI